MAVLFMIFSCDRVKKLAQRSNYFKWNLSQWYAQSLNIYEFKFEWNNTVCMTESITPSEKTTPKNTIMALHTEVKMSEFDISGHN